MKITLTERIKNICYIIVKNFEDINCIEKGKENLIDLFIDCLENYL